MIKDKILINLSASNLTKVWKQEFAKQSFPQKIFTAIWEVEAEVNNGGFAQSGKMNNAFLFQMPD